MYCTSVARVIIKNIKTGKKRLLLKHLFPSQFAHCRRSLISISTQCVHFMKKISACYFSTTYNVHDKAKLDFDLGDFPPENVRNFSIIAHVDHGKSTLADRLLENAGVISKSSKNKQVLDRLQVEKERGITVKAQTASLIHTYNGTRYLLNLVDTPGHVDFNYEVSRSLSACQGVILLVDANQGVQAQTVANFFLAFEKDLTIIPVLNKIDLPNAQPDVVMRQMNHLFDTQPEDILQISAKTGLGVEDVMDTIIERIPPPKADVNKPFKGLLFDSWYNKFRGVVVNVAVLEGVVRKGDKILSHFHKKTYEIVEIGLMYPTELPTDVLYAGQVGYIIANIKNIKDTRVGDTIYHKDQPVEPLPGFKAAKPMVFAGIFPSDQSEYNYVQGAIEKLTLNDSSVDVHVDSSAALGQGWRLGFLGLLHMDVFIQRLYQEHNFSVIVTAPNVPFKVKIFGEKNIKFYKTDTLTILNPCTLPDTSIIESYEEPMVKGTIIAPHEYLQVINNVCLERRGTFPECDFIDDRRVMITSILPLTEIVVDFFDELKSITSGYASFDYEDHGYQETELEKVHFMLNGKVIDELTMLLHTSKVETVAKRVCAKLKTSINRHLFLIAIQAGRGNKIICRENIKPLKKDVTAKCYGGDQSRKLKLLKNQAEGKKLMRQIGNIEVTKDAFITVLKK